MPSKPPDQQTPAQVSDETAPKKVSAPGFDPSIIPLALDTVGDGVWELNLVTNKASYSPRWKAMFGYAEDEIGDTVEEFRRLTFPEDRDLGVERLKRHIATGEPFENEVRMRCKD